MISGGGGLAGGTLTSFLSTLGEDSEVFSQPTDFKLFFDAMTVAGLSGLSGFFC